MSDKWMAISTDIVDREDLTIYEKMCWVVVSRYAAGGSEEDGLSSEILSKGMGCTVQESQTALEGLMEKGVLEFEFDEIDFTKVSGNIIKSGEEAGDGTVFGMDFESMDAQGSSDAEVLDEKEPQQNMTTVGRMARNAYGQNKKMSPPKPESSEPESETSQLIKSLDTQGLGEFLEKQTMGKKQPVVRKKPTKVSLTEQVNEIVDENINEREARIILSFADNDIEKVRAKYAIARNSQYNDKIEVLINELQKPDPELASKPRIIKANNSQINHEKIEQLKKMSKDF